jgi:hypothetical protein
MKVYYLRSDANNFANVEVRGGGLYEFSRRFNGRPLQKSEAEVELDYFSDDLPKGDYPGLIPNVPVFSERALHSLRDLLDGQGEALPVVCSGERYFLFNVTRVVDALDEDQTVFERFSSGKIMDIEQHVFLPDRIVGLTIFKIPQVIRMDVFVTDPFVDRVRSAGLKGFKLPLVWSSD